MSSDSGREKRKPLFKMGSQEGKNYEYMEVMDSKKRVHDLPEKAKQLIRQLTLSDDDYAEIERLMDASAKQGLSSAEGDNPPIKMLNSYVTKLPTGKERGEFLALDLGGTNYRVLLVRMEGNGEEAEIIEDVYAVPHELMTGTGAALFQFIAESVSSFLKENKVSGSAEAPLKLGFTFSFPCDQGGIGSAKLIKWTKGFCATGVENQDVCQLLQAAIDDRGLPIRCVALVNDTVGTLAACALEDPSCCIATIVGTGSNAAYIERSSELKRASISDSHVVINTEWGNFGMDGCLEKFRCQLDRDIDANSINPGMQIFEKLISGMYLGEIVRLGIKQLVDQNVLFDGKMPESLQQRMSFHTKYLSEIERDPPKHYYSTDQLLTVDLALPLVHPIDAAIVRELCEAVSTRSAFLVATGISCLLKRIQPDKPVTVGIDGSLFKFHPHFPERMIFKITQLYPKCQFKLKLSEDGSGKGAAAIAAMV